MHVSAYRTSSPSSLSDPTPEQEIVDSDFGLRLLDGGKGAEHFLARLKLSDTIQLSECERTRVVAVADLSAIEAQENYSLVHLVDGSRILIRRSLKAWSEILPSARFIRAHRKLIVNLANVTGYRREGRKAISLQLMGISKPTPVSRRLWSQVRTCLTIRCTIT